MKKLLFTLLLLSIGTVSLGSENPVCSKLKSKEDIQKQFQAFEWDVSKDHKTIDINDRLYKKLKRKYWKNIKKLSLLMDESKTMSKQHVLIKKNKKFIKKFKDLIQAQIGIKKEMSFKDMMVYLKKEQVKCENAPIKEVVNVVEASQDEAVESVCAATTTLECVSPVEVEEAVVVEQYDECVENGQCESSDSSVRK